MDKHNISKILSRFHAQLTANSGSTYQNNNLCSTLFEIVEMTVMKILDALFELPIKTSEQFNDDLSQLSIRHFAVTSGDVN